MSARTEALALPSPPIDGRPVLSRVSPHRLDVGYQWGATWTDGRTAEVAFAESKKDAEAAATLLRDLHPGPHGVTMVGRVQKPGAQAEIGWFVYDGAGPIVRLRRHPCVRPDDTKSTSPTPTTHDPSS